MSEKMIYDPLTDPDYQKPVIDLEEQRERAGIRHCYVHGYFEGTGVKFSIYFPEKEAFRGRFFQYLSPFPGPDEELVSQELTGEDDKIVFSLLNGAYFVESNMGSRAAFGGMADSKTTWKSSAAVAEFSRKKAMEYYDCSRPFGYVYGGSGGGYKTMACIENTRAWDGAVPYVIGSPVSLPNTITLHAQGQRTLRRVFGRIVDALDAGGGGDMYQGLTEDEAFMLREITAMGYPPQAWFMEAARIINDGSLPVLIPGVMAADPGYFQDFWEKDGYLGADPNSSARRDRLRFAGVVKRAETSKRAKADVQTGSEAWTDMDAQTVTGKNTGRTSGDKNGVDDAWQKLLAGGNGCWLELEETPTGKDLYLGGVNIIFTSGKAEGRKLSLAGIQGNKLAIGMCHGMDRPEDVLSLTEPGDTVLLDNSDYIAIQSYYRHQVPADLSFHAWDQFRDESGKPLLPQRENVMGYGFTGTGTVQDGDIQGRVIVIQSLMDESTCPWCGDWYRQRVIRSKGNEDWFRLYYMERCMHGDLSSVENMQITNYTGALRQALLDLSDWVEKGKEPLPSTIYELQDGQIHVETEARGRKGIQPVVRLRANKEECAHIKAGEEVLLEAQVQVPFGAGKVTKVSYAFGEEENLEEISCSEVYGTDGDFIEIREDELWGAISQVRHRYDRPGTYFAAVRVMAQREGSKEDIYTQIRNIGRARIIVE
jgi:hypothetical protein